MKKLNLKNKIPNEVYNDDFLALGEMCYWLSHPAEFSCYPDKAEIIDKKTLFWPPTKDTREMYIIRYTYYKFNEDNSDEIGIGVVGSKTFALFETNLLKMNSLEILATHCAWELNLDHLTPNKGMELLLKHNKNLK